MSEPVCWDHPGKASHLQKLQEAGGGQRLLGATGFVKETSK